MNETEEIRKLRKLLADANRGAEINAHINASLTAKLADAKRERDKAREVLREIAEASHFDNIGNWARNKAKEALKSI